VSALDDLAELEKLTKSPKTSRRPCSARTIESRRAARAKTSVSLESLIEDLDDRAAPMTVLRMVEAAGVKLSKPLTEAIRRGDTDMARVLKRFTDKIREAVSSAAEETIDELTK
jgi:hypothetical protein